MIKIIATDMDHTLLDDESLLPKEFSEVIDELIAKDIEFVCASGRTLPSLHNKVLEEKKRISFVADNGAVVEYHGEVIYKNPIAKEAWHEMVKKGRESVETSIVITTLGLPYIEVHNQEHRSMLREYYPEYHEVDNILDYDLEATKVTYLSLEHTISNFENSIDPAFGEDYNTVRAGYIWIDIMNKDVNKANGLKILLDRFNLSSDNLMAFGDFHNDIQMLQLANHSYAVGNALPEVKEIAKTTIGTNNENAVINTIKELILK